MKLLNTNTKLEKGGKQFDIVGLTLAPHKFAGFGNVCPWAGWCADVCNMLFSGHQHMPQVRDAMVRRTEWFFKNRPAFLDALTDEVSRHQRKAEKKHDVWHGFRPNVASDINWPRLCPELFHAAPDVWCYDYTKDIDRAEDSVNGHLPPNYWATYSYSEKSDDDRVLNLLRSGGNVAVVFDTIYVPSCGMVEPLPKKWKRFTVVDGDKHDFRVPEFDGKGKVIGLRGKGGYKMVRKGVEKGFIQRTEGGVMDLLERREHANCQL